MDKVPDSDTSNKQFFGQQQSQTKLESQSQQRLEATSPKQARSAHKQDLPSATNIHTRPGASHVGHLDIDTQQPLPRHRQRNLHSGICATRNTHTTGTSVDVTRRWQWSQGMLDVLQDLSLVLSLDGIIVCAPRTAKAVLGYEPEKLVNRSIADLIHPDEAEHFFHRLQESINQQADFGHYYHFRNADGEYSCFDVSGWPHHEEVVDPSGGSMHVSRGLSLSARLHPCRAAHALDIFFDIKEENETLRQKLIDIGVRQEELLEMGVFGGTLLQIPSPGHSSNTGGSGGHGQGPEGGPGQQKQQTQHQAALHPHQQQQQPSNRDSPATLNTFINSYLNTEDLAIDESKAAMEGSLTSRALHNTASYLDANGNQPSANSHTARTLSGNVVGTEARPAVADPSNLSYSGLAQQQKQHIPPSQDCYPFRSPEPFPFALYGATGYIESSPCIVPRVLPQRCKPILTQSQTSPRQQQTSLALPVLRPSPRQPPVQLLHASQSAGSPDQEELQTPRILPGHALTGSNTELLTGSFIPSLQQYTKDARELHPRSSETKARVVTLAQVQPTTTISQQYSPNHAYAKSPKRLRKTRAEGLDHVCMDCGTTDSPEWRRGPRGAKALCNACGLRFAKFQKKANGGAQNVSVQQMCMQPRTDT